MTDRELLELAAKAAGIKFEWQNSKTVKALPLNVRSQHIWNPLDYDSDAFRLMVDIGMNVSTPRKGSGDDTVFIEMVPPKKGSIEGFWVEEPIGADWRHDTRRAIVRAAAEIGRNTA